jgi:pimeloyl-ACP methyl ester carboxylesterase
VYALDTLDEDGLSVPNRPFRDRAECAEWLKDVLDALSIERAHVAGLSYGGWLALNFALAAPERVEKLVVLAPANSLLPIRREFFLRALPAMMLPLRFLGDSFMQWLFATPHAVKVFKELTEQIACGLKSFRPMPPVIPSVFSDDELRQVAVPALLLIGDKEVIYDPHAALERAARLIPHVETTLIPGAGHALIGDQPAQVDARMLKFLIH